MTARVHLTIAQKNRLRAYHRANPNVTQQALCDWVARKMGRRIQRSTVSKILSEEPETTTINPHAKRKQVGRFPEMERRVFAFVQAQPASASVSDLTLWAKANEILAEQGTGQSVSVSWVTRFKERHGLKACRKRPSVSSPQDTNESADTREPSVVIKRSGVRQPSPRVSTVEEFVNEERGGLSEDFGGSEPSERSEQRESQETESVSEDTPAASVSPIAESAPPARKRRRNEGEDSFVEAMRVLQDGLTGLGNAVLASRAPPPHVELVRCVQELTESVRAQTIAINALIGKLTDKEG